ncbi:IS481 family transposase [Arthrobacter burdickii]|uniref:IS481 family transposase n=1 Tax=Arthrobacter burdickii TaxID=3035920 RepID=A0ABT8JW73_9MICC|nr:IS481 family transposase [Arthrobacter burdickii]MDN4609423.1 IS481 family transposase [Arthrobacter burdickii]MDN4611813.1 IS481 family transposase [Arthrobacter burdickii]
MSHVNARLTVHGRQLLVDRVAAGRPVAHIAAELGVSRQTAYRWVGRYRAEGTAGLRDRSSRPRSSPRRTSADREQEVLQARQALRFGPLRIAAVTGVPARTVTRILHRHQVPRLADCDPLTGTPIRASRASSNRYERTTPGELVHLDVKKLGRIPAGGGWRAHGRSEQVRGRGIGYDYVHVAIDDHTRVGYAEVLPDEKGATAAGFLVRAGIYFAEQGINRIERVITDNAFAYRNSAAFARAVADLGAVQRFIKPHCPWTNGKAERFNRTLQTEWAYRQVFTSSAQRQAALAPWLQHYNTERIHTGIGATPITRVSPT